jgi:prepilin-type N-terminal cleavage/methylation domain-containing protein
MFKKISNKKTKKFAFSLIELSIVLLVIGILMVGVSQGYNIVRSAQISNARSITAKSPILQIQGLLAWYETSWKESLIQSELKDGNNISAWKDISPNSILNGYNQLTTTPSTNITYTQSSINKIPAIKFTGSSKLSLGTFTQGASSQATVFLVVKLNYVPDTTNYKTIFDGNSADFSFSLRSNGIQINTGSSVVSSNVVANSFLNSGEYVIAIYFNGSNSKVYVNDTDSMFGGSVINNPSGTSQLEGVTLGATRSGSLGFAGYISEVAIFNRVIKAGERKEIFNYFSKKYKIDITGV